MQQWRTEMPEPDMIFRRLDHAARRIRLNERLEDGARLFIGVLVLVTGYRLLDAALGPGPVMSALLPLFFLAAATLFVWCVWRLFGRDVLLPPDRAAAAIVVDARAGLHNESASALWFATRDFPDDFIRLHISRAAQSLARVDPARLVPLVLPRSLPAAVVLLVVSVALLAMPTRIAPVPDTQDGASQLAQRGAGPLAARDSSDETGDATDEVSGQLTETAWLKVEKLARELRAGPHSAEVAQAIAARDASKASRLLAGMRQKETALPSTGAAARPEVEQMSEQLAKGIVDRLQSLLNEGGGWSEQAPADDAGGTNQRATDDLTRELREEIRDAQESLPGEMSPEEEVLNTTLQGMSRDSTGGREVVRGEASPMQGLGRTSVGSGAMGRRVGVSTGGAGSGDQPVGDPDGDAEAQPVLGARTMRLQLQMQTVKIDEPDTELSEGSEESFYAATQAQAANTQYQNIVAEQRGGAEQGIGEERLPIAYRDAARAYSVRQHRRETAEVQ